MSYNHLSLRDLLDRVNQHSSINSADQPPFTLILGSGFSAGVIPTTSQIVRQDLPWWIKCQRSTPPKPDYRTTPTPPDDESAREEARQFWAKVHRSLPPGGPNHFDLSNDGLPTPATIGDAYRFVLSARCSCGLSTPRHVRQYFGDIIRRADRRLNPAHLFLASLIAAQPKLFGTIFTTNFDPLLQRSLQLVNAPYFVSDRPETLEHPDDDGVIDAVHIVHAHGSIYRYLLLNSPETIEKYAAANQPKLQAYFQKHPVLIVGFSGWDDAITRALSHVTQFDCNLYWCDRASTPETSSLSPAARKILAQHDNAFYVPIHSADDLMAKLHLHLLRHALPRLFRDPILSARDQLNSCDFTGMRLPRPSAPPPEGATEDKSAAATDELDLATEVESVLKRLDDAQNLFTGKTSTDPKTLIAAAVRNRLATAFDLYFAGKYAEALSHLDFALANADTLDPSERAFAYGRRGLVHGLQNDTARAIEDFSRVIDMKDTPPELVAMALVNRGFAHRLQNDTARAIEDYSRVVDMKEAPPKGVAKALFNRGFAHGRQNDTSRAIEDYSRVVDMNDAPPDQVAMALYNRGVVHGQRNDITRAIDDFSRVIDMNDAPPEHIVKALISRGLTLGQQNDTARAIDDFSRVIDMTDAPPEHVANALINRGVAHRLQNDTAREIEDYSRVIDMTDAPPEQVAQALFNRGVAHGQQNDTTREIEDYSRVIDMKDAPPKQVAKALLNRGITHRQQNDTARATEDFSRVINMTDAPPDARELAARLLVELRGETS